MSARRRAGEGSKWTQGAWLGGDGIVIESEGVRVCICLSCGLVGCGGSECKGAEEMKREKNGVRDSSHCFDRRCSFRCRTKGTCHDPSHSSGWKPTKSGGEAVASKESERGEGKCKPTLVVF